MIFFFFHSYKQYFTCFLVVIRCWEKNLIKMFVIILINGVLFAGDCISTIYNSTMSKCGLVVIYDDKSLLRSPHHSAMEIMAFVPCSLHENDVFVVCCRRHHHHQHSNKSQNQTMRCRWSASIFERKKKTIILIIISLESVVCGKVMLAYITQKHKILV